MATNDAIAQHGGLSANFTDFGGSAIHEQIDAVIHLVNANPTVKVIFINCYGGITSIKKVVATIIHGLEMSSISKPVVLRVKGNESENAEEMLADWINKHPIYIERDFDKAVKLAVEIAD